MTGEKKNRNKNEMLTLCIPYISLHIGNTQSVSISFLFLFFFHQSSLYPIKIFVKYFYLPVCILFSVPYARASASGSIDDCACA